MAFYDNWVAKFSAPGYLESVVGTAIWGFLSLVIIAFGIYQIRNVIKYRYKGEIEKRRQDNWDTKRPDSERLSGKAGYFKRKGMDVYRIKYGIFPWQIIEAKKLPDPRFMQGRTAYFMMYNVGELVQAQKTIDWETGEIKIEPVDSTTKSGAKQEMKEYVQVFTRSNLLKENMGIAIMGIILIAGIIALYFTSRACGG